MKKYAVLLLTGEKGRITLCLLACLLACLVIFPPFASIVKTSFCKAIHNYATTKSAIFQAVKAKSCKCARCGFHAIFGGCTKRRAGPLYIQRQKYRYSLSGCSGIFLVGEGPNPLEDPYLKIRGCAFNSERWVQLSSSSSSNSL